MENYFWSCDGYIWQNRNNKVFNDRKDLTNQVCGRVIRQAQAFHQSSIVGLLTSSLNHQASHSNIQWSPPAIGTWKLNCDGAVSGFGNNASAGARRGLERS